jgi:hypothetical protein
MRETEHRVTSVLTFLSLLVAKKSRAMGVRDPVMAAVALAFRYGTEVDDINWIRSTLFSLNIGSRSFHFTHITVYPRISGSDLPWSARKTLPHCTVHLQNLIANTFKQAHCNSLKI